MILIDTAHDVGYVARGDQLFLMEGKRHSESCALLLEKVWRLGPVTCIGVGVGPGSYTGLRVGIALAQGLHLATGVPLVGYCSLEAYWEEGAVSLFDARAGGAYCFDGQRAFRASIEELSQIKASLLSPDAEKIQERLGPNKLVKSAHLNLNRVAKRLQRGEGFTSLTPLYLKNLA